MLAVGKRAKMENKGREVSNLPSSCFSDLRIKRLPAMNSAVWRLGGVCACLPNTLLMFNSEKFKFPIEHRNKCIWTVKLVLPLLAISILVIEKNNEIVPKKSH
jgi:hypothetical protein